MAKTSNKPNRIDAAIELSRRHLEQLSEMGITEITQQLDQNQNFRYGNRQINRIVALEQGHYLHQARPNVPYGKWYSYLDARGISSNQAERWMALADAGCTPSDILEHGSLEKTLKSLMTRICPEPETELNTSGIKLPEPEPDDWPALGEPEPENEFPENGNVGIHCSEPPDKPPTRLEELEVQLAAQKARIDDLQGRVAFDDADGYIAAQEQEVRVGRTRIGDLITESDTRRRAAEYWERRYKELEAMLPHCVKCGDVVIDDPPDRPRCCKGCAGKLLAQMGMETPAVG